MMKRGILALLAIQFLSSGAFAQGLTKTCIPTGDNQSCQQGWLSAGKTAITNTAVTVKGAPGKLGSVFCDNNNAAWSYLQFFNSSSVTVGTTANVGFLPLAPNLATTFVFADVGIFFSSSIKVAASTTPGGGTAPATNTLNCTFGYD